jgi:hypothetical protein
MLETTEVAWIDARGREDGWNGSPWQQMYRDDTFAGEVYRTAYRVGELQRMRERGDILYAGFNTELERLQAKRREVLVDVDF